MFDGAFSPWHLLIVAGIFVILFGSKKLPDAARSMGRSLRIFKSEVKELTNDSAAPRASVIEPAAPVTAAAPVTEPAPVSSDNV